MGENYAQEEQGYNKEMQMGEMGEINQEQMGQNVVILMMKQDIKHVNILNIFHQIQKRKKIMKMKILIKKKDKKKKKK